MPDNSKATGQCLCGAVTVTLIGSQKEVGICHCSMCRRWGGAPNMAMEVGQEIEIEGKDHVSTYRSSDWAERAFCKTCGSNLYYRLVETGDHMVCVGLLNNQADLELSSQIFIEEKPQFYAFANKTKTMTGAEVFAMYAPSQDNKREA